MVRPPKAGLKEHVVAKIADRRAAPPPADVDTSPPARVGVARSAARRSSGVVGWVKAAPHERLPLPIGAGLYGAGGLVSALDVPSWGLATAGVGVSLAVYGQATKRLGDEGRAAKVTAAPAAATAWLATASELGVVGPQAWAYLGLYGAAYGVYRLDGATRGRIAWRREKADWHRTAGLLGLRGSHLLAKEPTRLGERLVVDVTGTGQRASTIARSDLHERVAELHGLRTSRVKVREGYRAGRITISIRYKDPWGVNLLHPLLDEDAELQLPDTADVCEPLVLGMDPETGRPLTLEMWTPDGGQNTMVVAMKRSGKTVFLNCVLERTTAAFNACPWGISVAKGKVIQRWAPALDLAAYGRDQRTRGLRILELGCKAINYRESMSDRPTLRPDRDHPLIPIIMDEMSAGPGASDNLGYAYREALSYINSKGGSEGVVSVLAGQRGTQSHVGDTDIRTQVDNYVMLKVARQSEMSNFLGEMAYDLPNMSTYGEGRAGVTLIASVHGDYSVGRTFFLDDFDEIEEIAADREPTPLEPGLVEHLGDQYLRLKYGDDALTARLVSPGWPDAAAGGRSSAEYLAQLDKDVEAGLPEDLRQFIDEAGSKIRKAQADLGAVPLPPEPDPDLARKLEESAAHRNDQVGRQAPPVPDNARKIILDVLGEGPSATGKLAERLGVTSVTAWRYLSRLRTDGVVEAYGRGRGARWRLTGDGNSAAQPNSE